MEQRKREQHLILSLKKHPSRGLAAAIAEYGGVVKWITLNILGNKPQDVEECISDTFVSLWQSIDRFDPERNTSLKSYLCGIARHTALNYRRKLYPAEALLPMEEIEIEAEGSINQREPDEVLHMVTQSLDAEIVRNALHQLPSPDRDIFIYRYYFYEKVSDIAKRLDLPLKTVENKLYRGKKKLKEYLIKGGILND